MFYSIVRWIFGFIIMVLFNVQVEGAERLPREGPVIVCANHISWWDPPLVACILKRPVFFMAKKELFGFPIFGYLLKKLNAFPVDREGVDIGAIKKGISALSKRQVLGIFPEGTRQKSKDALGEAHPGAALLALRTRSPVFPIAIRGQYTFRGRIRVLCGEAFTLDLGNGRLASNLQKGSSMIMSRIRELWEKLSRDEKA